MSDPAPEGTELPICSNASAPVYKGGVAALWSNPWVLLTVGALFWSSNVVIGRAMAGHVPPITLAFLRWAVALLVMLPFAWPKLRRDWPALLANWRIMLALSLTGITIQNTLVYYGLTTTVALNGLLFQSATPIVVLIWAFALFREQPSARQTGGVLISLAGVAVIVTHGALADLIHLRLNGGDAFILAGMTDYALYAVLLRRRPSVHPLSFLAASFGLGATMLLPVVAAELVFGPAMQITPVTVGGVIYLAIFPALLSYLFFNRGVELIGSARAGQSLHLVPLFGSLLAVAFLGEQPHWFHAAGIALIAAGLVLAQRKARALPWTRWGLRPQTPKT
jgi:drug/metabolite transporter (DMT)-like permease